MPLTVSLRDRANLAFATNLLLALIGAAAVTFGYT
jgi:hypothetical protein